MQNRSRWHAYRVTFPPTPPRETRGLRQRTSGLNGGVNVGCETHNTKVHATRVASCDFQLLHFHPPGQCSTSPFPSLLPVQSKTIQASPRLHLLPSERKPTLLRLCQRPMRMSMNQRRIVVGWAPYHCPVALGDSNLCKVLALSLLPSHLISMCLSWFLEDLPLKVFWCCLLLVHLS